MVVEEEQASRKCSRIYKSGRWKVSRDSGIGNRICSGIFLDAVEGISEIGISHGVDMLFYAEDGF